MKNKYDLTGKISIVTGGARGIGKSITTSLIEMGSKVVVIGKKQNIEDFKDEMQTSFGADIDYISCDLSNRIERQKLIPIIFEKYKKIDILINNAGSQFISPALNYPLDKWDDLISLMLTAPMELSQSIGDIMKNQKQGKIINILSVYSFQGGRGVLAYAAAKSGLLSITKTFANELAPYGVQVNSVTPGYIETDMILDLNSDEKRKNELMGRIPSNRFGKPKDVASAVLFLCSDDSNYIVGTNINVDGGFLCR